MINMNNDTKKVFHCPQCGKSLSIDIGKDFKKGRCPSCRSRIVIPTPDKKK
jgi:DNA-directed RNA polymerase subunit RPC12/RpoP